MTMKNKMSRLNECITLHMHELKDSKLNANKVYKKREKSQRN